MQGTIIINEFELIIFNNKLWTLLSFADSGAMFIFGGHSSDLSNFAFGVLPIIVYFSVIINVLYYIGVMDFVINKVIVRLLDTFLASRKIKKSPFDHQNWWKIWVCPVNKFLSKVKFLMLHK